MIKGIDEVTKVVRKDSTKRRVIKGIDEVTKVVRKDSMKRRVIKGIERSDKSCVKGQHGEKSD